MSIKGYLNFIERKRQIDQVFDLNQHELRLLDLTVQAYFSNQSIFVRNLINQKEVASQATLHKSLKALINKNLLVVKPFSKDGRQKNIFPTKSALERYRKIDSAMKRVTN